MAKHFNPSRAHENHPEIPLLDIHYYGLKGFGISDKNIAQGHPKFHLIGSDFLFSVTALISSPNSPYELTNKLRFKGEELPFWTKYIGRVNRTLGYFYYRGIQEWIPTLDSETILSANFNPHCNGCSFCSRVECAPEEEKRALKNINGNEGIAYVINQGVNLSKVDKITIVTGMFKDESETRSHIKEVARTAKINGFKGRILYIGSQIKSNEGVRQVLDSLGDTPFKYAYTLETFTNREIMHPSKRGALESAIQTIRELATSGLKELEYSYIPGIDKLDDFLRNAPLLVGFARPHLSIFRSATEKQKELPCAEFLQEPVEYLCQMRKCYERLYGGPIYANNLANLWPFPTNRINPLFLTEKTQAD